MNNGVINILISGNNTKLILKTEKETQDITLINCSESLIADGVPQNFDMCDILSFSVDSEYYGKGEVTEVIRKNNGLEQRISYIKYLKYPDVIFIKAKYKNLTGNPILINSYKHNNYRISFDGENEIPFWAYFGASYDTRPDWIQPLKVGFAQANYMGMNSSDYGGGTPVIDIWNKDYGIAIGHTQLKQEEIFLPVQVFESYAEIGILCNINYILNPGETYETMETFVMVHSGDCFSSLSTYRKILIDKGLEFTRPTDEAYQITWNAWGYERNFKMEDIYNTLPEIKKLGIKWVGLDDGYQTEEGDLELQPDKFPNGDVDMRNFVNKIHENGMKAQLWWIPLAADPNSRVYKEHQDWLLINKYGQKQYITWWDSYYLCPAYKPVQDHVKEQLKKILIDWDFDGLKIDGQFLNSAPKCYNPVHNHVYHDESIEWMSLIMKTIYEMAKDIKKDVTIYYCPCGATYSIFTLPYYNIAVASDPKNSWQIRLKGHVLRALGDNNIAYHGDHIELSDNHCDFASVVGIGAVLDTKFTWPPSPSRVSLLLPNELDPYTLDERKEKLYKQWIDIYNEKMLSKGKYIGDLYTIGFDFPETHVINKDGKLYYSFYADEWDGNIEFRGLKDNKKYIVYDYVNNKVIGSVDSNCNFLHVKFTNHLLVELTETN